MYPQPKLLQDAEHAKRFWEADNVGAHQSFPFLVAKALLAVFTVALR